MSFGSLLLVVGLEIENGHFRKLDAGGKVCRHGWRIPYYCFQVVLLI